MISPDVDARKAKTLLLYLSLAKHKIDQREFARKKLDAKISALKNVSTSSIKKHVEDLEKDIAEAIKKEHKIVTSQKVENQFHKELVDKIDKLEGRLEKYLATKEARKKRIQQLEDKIKQKLVSRKEKIREIKDSIKHLEELYKKAKKDKKVSRMRLKSIKSKIEKLKAQLKVKAKKL